MNTIGEWWMWVVFLVFVAMMLAVDMFLCGGRKAHRVSTKEAFVWTGIWIVLALFFNFLLWSYLRQTATIAVANEKALEFFAGYLIEKSLSIDNVFVFLMIFGYFSVPAEYQRRVLLYGIIGAILMRLVFIVAGIWLIARFHWLLYIFGFCLFIFGIKMFVFANKQPDLSQNPVLKWMKKHLRVTDQFHGEQFFVWRNRLLYVTPLFLVLVLIEVTDLIFAVDSIPAIFAVTSDPFIVFTSNIFAMLGLRALYFLFANLSTRFYFLKYGLAFILTFVGIKLLIAHWYAIPVVLALAVVAATLLLSIAASIYYSPRLLKNSRT